jgi:hypothetical protein
LLTFFLHLPLAAALLSSPHPPWQGAIDLMMSVYKEMLPSLGGYLTRGAQVDLAKVEKFIQRIGSFEDVIFQKRMRLLSRCVAGADFKYSEHV